MTQPTESRFTAAAAQMTATDDMEANLAICKDLASQAADRGARLLVLPECFAYLGVREADKLAAAEAIDADKPGPILEAITGIARDHSLWLVAGGMPERLPGEETADEPTKVYNTAIVLSPDGVITALYRKIHLFDVAIPGRAEFRESGGTARGSEVVVAETALGRIGLSICYDLRFPELYRELALGLGAQIIVVPAAFTAHTGAAHWHSLLRSRAIENQCYVIAAAQSGRHNEKRETYGHSLIIDPWGAVVAEIEAGTGLAVGEIDLEMLARTRQEMPCRDHTILL